MQPKEQGFNRNILGLRGLCAISVVVLHHYNGPRDAGWFSSTGITDFWITSLQSAVDLFFMISGFLMVPALLRANSAMKFATNRFIRIYPAYFATIAPVFIAGPFVHYKYLAPGIVHWLCFVAGNALLLQAILSLPPANFIAWTLCYEAGFYLVVAAIFLAHRRWGRTAASALGVILTGLCVAAQPFVYAFATGALVWWLGENGRSCRPPAVLCPILLVVFMGLTEHARQATGAAAYLTSGLAFLVSVPLFSLLASDGLSAILRHRIFQYLGRISYSLYLWHPVIMFATKSLTLKVLPHAPAWQQVTFLAAIGLLPILWVSDLSHRLIEVRLADWLRARVKPGLAGLGAGVRAGA